jgi:CPA1 family monovalent cation:H+ antiporter
MAAPAGLGKAASRHHDRVGRLPRSPSDGFETASAVAELRSDLIAAEREFIYRLLREGKITDEARRRIERELDLEEAAIVFSERIFSWLRSTFTSFGPLCVY